VLAASDGIESEEQLSADAVWKRGEVEVSVGFGVIENSRDTFTLGVERTGAS
jgi:hypothetical protein